MRFYLVTIVFLIGSYAFGQDTISLYKSKRVAATDTIVLDSVSINSSYFELKTKTGVVLDTSLYKVNFALAKVFLSKKAKSLTDTLTVNYLKYPDFLTRTYFVFDPKIIVKSNSEISQKLQKLEETNYKKETNPFEGLSTLGSITRGITVGNNQNAVVNSELDLQITGKLSDKVSIRASIQDANIPTQEGGYSQNLDEFDQIFIELYSKYWNIRAGDVNLQNTGTFFGNFTKKVQGISLSGKLVNKDSTNLTAYAAGALVRGVFTRSTFTGQDGNQGPYKLTGPNGELFVLIVSGSERVFVNGILLKRGENNDYVIDYNAGEITFNPTYPVTDAMRIVVEYQFTDRSYTRFVGYAGGRFTSKKLDVGVYLYSESDAKNQPLQQNLTQDQVAVLQQAGDNPDLMLAPSAIPETYSENKILYKKEVINGVEVFVFSTTPEDQLFSVKFTFVGENAGDYIVSQNNTISQIFEYVPPVNGIKQGSYEPVFRVKAPERLQVGGVTGSYHPSEKTQLSFEVSGSKNDLNLFSALDDENNTGYAGRVSVNQQLWKPSDSLKLTLFSTLNHLSKNYKTIERLYNVEFSRDWNLTNPQGNQTWISSGIRLQHLTRGDFTYAFEQLNYSQNFSGNRHLLTGRFQSLKFAMVSTNSMMKSNDAVQKSSFFRTYNKAVYAFKKAWIGSSISTEDNTVTVTENDSLTPLSQRFSIINPFIGIGDSTKIYVETGYRHRVTDSVVFNKLNRVHTAQTVYASSRLLQNNTSTLQLFANYRTLKRLQQDKTEETVNTRLLYNQSAFKQMIRFNTVIENNNGVIPQQEFTYVKVAAGEGQYAWNDYNNNGVQELEEFEIAQFQDQAEYIRVLLPNKIFIKTRQTNFSQLVTLNPSAWNDKEGLKKILSHFYNQTAFTLNRKVKKDDKVFEINPFKDGGENELGLVRNFKNILFYNRGKQHFTTGYTYISSTNKNTLSFGFISSLLKNHQLRFTHKLKESWLLNLTAITGIKKNISDAFTTRNFTLDNQELNPKIAYLFSAQSRVEFQYLYKTKENRIGQQERLKQQAFGILFFYNKGSNTTINADFNYINNTYSGSAFSPVAYEILEGLQPGTNFTWQLLLQKKITKFLDVNLSYFGRKSEQSKTIHTGSMQLRAYF